MCRPGEEQPGATTPGMRGFPEATCAARLTAAAGRSIVVAIGVFKGRTSMKIARMTMAAASLMLGVAAAAWAEDPVGHWVGSLKQQDGTSLAVGLKVTKGADGKLAGVGESAQSADPIPMENLASDGAKLSLTSAALQGSYEGVWDAASKSWKGTWTQNGQGQPLALTRAPN
jgi:hypothetical protein